MDRLARKDAYVWHLADEKPLPDSRIVMLFPDRSGAELWYWTGRELIDAEGREEGQPWPLGAGELWAYLPDSCRLWFEQSETRNAFIKARAESGTPNAAKRRQLAPS